MRYQRRVFDALALLTHVSLLVLQYASKQCQREWFLGTFRSFEVLFTRPYRLTLIPLLRILTPFIESFPPGKHNRIPRWPRVQEVNKLGDYRLTADREHDCVAMCV